MKPIVEATLILAYDNEDCGTPKDIFLFHAIHEPGIDFDKAIRTAFEEWAETKEGLEYIDSNGVNWGDATYIPEEILGKHKIYSYDNAEKMDSAGCHVKIDYKNKLIVDHNEALINVDEIDRDMVEEDAEADEEKTRKRIKD